MELTEIQERLKESGREVGPIQPNSDGTFLLLVDGVYMFYRDGADLVRGRATLEQIVTRNAGKNIPIV